MTAQKSRKWSRVSIHGNHWPESIIDAVPPETPRSPEPLREHQSGEFHDYRPTCTVCGEHGTLHLSILPQRFGDES